MNYKLIDLVDIKLLQELMEKLDKIYSFPSAILDLEGKILVAVSWQDICTKFHRANPQSEKECIKSDKYIQNHLHDAKPSVSYKCPLGLIDNAFPIIINGQHLGNFFTGQFFLEKPDKDYFIEQAKKYGYDEVKYLEAVENTPIWNQEKLNTYLDFIKQFIEIISGIGLKNLLLIEAETKLKEKNLDLIEANLIANKLKLEAEEAKRATEIANTRLKKEIKDRELFEIELGNSEALYKAILNASPDDITIADLSGRILLVSPSAVKLFNFDSIEDIIGKQIFDFIIPKEREIAIDRINKMKQGVILAPAEYHGINSDGDIFNIEVNSDFIRNFKGEPEKIVLIIRDITARKLTEKAIRLSKKRYDALTKTTFDGYWVCSVEGEIIEVNDSYYKMSGYSNEELIGKNISDIEYLQDKLEIQSKMETLIQDEYIRFETIHKTKNKGLLILEASIVYLKDENIVIAFFNNITSRKKTENELLESENRFRTIFESAPDAMILADPESGQILEANRVACSILGREHSELLKMNQVQLHPHDQTNDSRNQFLNHVKESSELGNTKPVEEFLVNSSGDKIPVEVVAQLVMFHDKKVLMGIFRDITDRKLSKEKLSESEARFKQVSENAKELIWEIDQNGLYTYVNSIIFELLGYTPEEVIGKKYFYDFFDENIREECKNLAFQRFIDKEPINNFINKNIHQSGHEVFLLTSGVPILDSENNLIGYRGLDIDITERVQADIQREQQLKFTKALNQIAEIIISTDIAEEIIYNINAIVGNALGVDRALIYEIKFSKNTLMRLSKWIKDINDENPYMLIDYSLDFVKSPLEALKKLRSYLISHYNNMNPYFIPFGLGDYLHNKMNIKSLIWYPFSFHEDGFYILALNQFNKNKLWNDEEIGFIESATKQMTLTLNKIKLLTERKKSEENLLKLSTAIEQSQVSIVITNIDGIIEYVNPKFLQVAGYTKSEVLGANTNILKSGETSTEEYKLLWDTILSGKEWNGIFRNKKKNGELFWESVTISPIKNDLKEITNFVAVKEDITEKKELELNLQKALERAEEMNRLKSNFLANMNHELRTPLNGILGFAGILSEQLRNKDYNKMASAILLSGKRLSETLNLILDLSNVEAANISINLHQIEVVPIVKNVIDLFQATILHKNLELHFIVKNEQLFANLDKLLFPRIIHNILDNAIKYTNQGSVTIEIGDVAKDTLTPHFYINISDTGIGIPNDKIPIIWEAFRQVSEGLSRSYEGTGLGLTIARKLTFLMKGSISVESNVGIGSTFRLTFPSVPINNINSLEDNLGVKIIEKQNEIGQNVDNSVSILCVEDDIINLNLVKMFLKGKYKLDTAVNAFNALELINKNNYDVILMDINLGADMNGLQAIKEIRKLNNYLTTPIIAVTAYTTEADKEEFFAAGFTHYLAKPFSNVNLINLIKDILKN